jgi:hypothetical protein
MLIIGYYLVLVSVLIYSFRKYNKIDAIIKSRSKELKERIFE